MSEVTIKDKTFKTFIPEADLLRRVMEVANRISHDFE